MNELFRHPVITTLAGLLAPDQECYLVGGALRDTLLGRPVSDFDFAVPFDPTNLARSFARQCGGTWFSLDEERLQSRVVLRMERGEFTCDFAPFRAVDLQGDLRLRDFTINAMALRVDGGARGILDPLGGKTDLEERRLRACSAGVFSDDPLRVMKGLRHVAVLKFGLEERTRGLMSVAATSVPGIAAERLRSEMAGIFSVSDPAPALDLLRDLGLEGHFFTPSDDCSLQRGLGLVRRVQELIELVSAHGEGDLLGEELEGEIDRGVLMRMGAMLRGYGPGSSEHLVRQLKLGKRSGSVLNALCRLEESKVKEIDHLPDYPRGRALWVAGLGPDPWTSSLFVGVLGRRPPGESVPEVLGLLEDLRAVLRGGRIPDLVDGNWLRKELGWERGPAIGRALSEVRRMEVRGGIRNAGDARNYLKSLDQKMIDKNSDEPL